MKKELAEATSQLVQKSNELLNCKFDLQRHRLEIDVSSCANFGIIGEWPAINKEYFSFLKQQKLNQDICNLSTLCSVQKESSSDGLNMEQITNSPGWKQAIIEAKRQYEAIDHALEVRVIDHCVTKKLINNVSYRHYMMFNLLSRNVQP